MNSMDIWGKSTRTKLLFYQGFVVGALVNGSQVGSIWTDFSKAFNRVNHGLLLSKLEVYGTTGNLLNCIKGYFTNKTQCVKPESFVSDHINVTSVVSQGSPTLSWCVY